MHTRWIKSYVNCERMAGLLLSCQATGRLRVGHGGGSHPPPLSRPAGHPASWERAHKPAPSQVCGQPSLPELLRSPRPWRDLQFSPFIYTPSPWLHITSEWCGRMAAADPGLGGAVSADPSPAPLEGRGPGHVTHSVALCYATIQKEWCAFYQCSN